VLSLLDPSAADEAAAAAARKDASNTTWLSAIVQWVRRTFVLVSDAEAYSSGRGSGGDDGAAGGPSTSGQGGNGAEEYAAAAVAAALGADNNKKGKRRRKGDSSGNGAASRLMRMLKRSGTLEDQLQRCLSSRRGTAEQLNTLLVAVLRALGLLVRTTWALDAVPFRPAMAEAALMRQVSSQGTAAPMSSSGHAPSATAAAVGAGAGATGGGESSSGRGRGGGGGRARGRGRAASSKSPARPRSAGSKGAAAESDLEGAAAEAAAASAAAPRNRGDEELQRQLEMAMAATAAAAAAAKQARVNDDSAAAQLLPLPGGRTSSGGLRQLSRQQVAAAGGSSNAATGQAWSSAGAQVPRCWAEVYCGSSATGRWVAVDAVAGWCDTPDAVDRGTARPQPLSYVVAVQGGAPKDVTRRYAASYTATLKHRDDAWWTAAMCALRDQTAHLPPGLQAAVAASGAAAHAAAGGGGEAAGGGMGRGGGAGSGRAAGPGGAPAAADAALRAKREEAELAHREAAHRHDVPRTIEGFKGHAVYVLQRHVGKYQVRFACFADSLGCGLGLFLSLRRLLVWPLNLHSTTFFPTDPSFPPTCLLNCPRPSNHPNTQQPHHPGPLPHRQAPRDSQRQRALLRPLGTVRTSHRRALEARTLA